jgi:single-strand DNA-binding protein
MTDLNSVVLIGRLTGDIGEKEFGYLPTGNAKLSFSIAVNRSYQKNGQWVDDASYFDVQCFGKFAENYSKKLFKGCQVAVSGSLKQDRWKDQSGQNKSRISIIADFIEILTKMQNTNAPQNGYPQNDNYDGQFQDESFNGGYGAPFGN